MVKLNLVSVMISLGVIYQQMSQSSALSNFLSETQKLSIQHWFQKLTGTGGDDGSSFREESMPPSSAPTSILRMRKFGCTFRNKDYHYHGGSIFTPAFGSGVEPMDFHMLTDFMDLYNSINEHIYPKFLSDVVYNNIPLFYDFYDTYKNQSDKKFIRFFKNYQPKFIPGNSASMAIELLDRLVDSNPAVSQHVHLVTASMNTNKNLLYAMGLLPPPEGDENYANASVLYTRPPKYFFYNDHIAAILRFRLENERLGYMLLDPGSGLKKPMIFMEDGGYPEHENTTTSYLRDIIGVDVEFSLPNSNYILASTGFDYTLYYIGEPYCSFQATTVKQEITKPTKAMVRRNKLGMTLAHVSFRTTPEARAFDFTARSPKIIRKTRISFGTRHNLDETLLPRYQEFLGAMNYEDVEDILDKAETIAIDKPFLIQLQTLNEFIQECISMGDIPF